MDDTSVTVDNLKRDTTAVFSGFDWASDTALSNIKISVIGAGGIGSWFIFLASRIGYKIHCYDDDTIERSNLGGQLYKSTSIGKLKVDSIATLSNSFSPQSSVTPMAVRYDEQISVPDSIIVSAVDNMVTRQLLYSKFKERVELFISAGYTIADNGIVMVSKDGNIQPASMPTIMIDGRLLAEQFQIYAVTPGNIERYKETLFDDDEIEDDLCSMRQTSHFAAGIAFNMIRVMNNYISNLLNPDCGREVPFSINDDGLLLLTTIEI